METEDEWAVAKAFVERLLKQFSGEMRQCVHCQAPIETLHKVGRCVYARPCGCRQYQGGLPDWAKKPKGVR